MSGASQARDITEVRAPIGFAAYETRGFVPHRFIRGAHAQTLAGVFHRMPPYDWHTRRHLLELDAGSRDAAARTNGTPDRTVLHDDCPADWRDGDRCALLVHGLAGSHASGYMQRIAAKLMTRGVRPFRLDLRGCGAGQDLARLPYHSGQSADVRAALALIAEICPRSPVSLIGFSLGANIVLKLLGELKGEPCGGLDRAAAVSPPLDLEACCQRIGRGVNKLYDQYFVRMLMQDVRRRLADRNRNDLVRRVSSALIQRPPRSLFEFDDRFTAPLGGFKSAVDYYNRCSSRHFISAIRKPTLLLASTDDPLIGAEPYQTLSAPTCVQVRLTRAGGHLGFLASRSADSDWHWMDWRVVDFASADV